MMTKKELIEQNEILKYGIWVALSTLRNDKYATRAYNAAVELEALLDEHGYPSADGS
jgi:hypothetical protein